MDGWMDGWMDGKVCHFKDWLHTGLITLCVCVCVCVCVCMCMLMCTTEHIQMRRQLNKSHFLPGVVAYAFNPSTREAEAGRFLSSRPAWSTK
jgi:hypothetical protein